MSFSAIANFGLFANHNSLISSTKIGVIAIALHAIQSLGVFAQTCLSTESDSHCPNAPDVALYWQDRYASRANLAVKQQKNQGMKWIFPQSEKDWSETRSLYHSLSSSRGCKGLSLAQWIGFKGIWVKVAYALFCKQTNSFYEYYRALLGCQSSQDLMKCINAAPENREAALKSLAATIETVLPHTAEESEYLQIKDCLASTDCLDIDKEKSHPREKKAAENAFTTKVLKTKREKLENWFASNFVAPEWKDVQEVLRFRSDDPREKFLFISAEKDHNGALDPGLIAEILSKLSQKYDLKFQVIKKHSDICKLIDSAQKVGNLGYVLITGHGDSEGIVFDANDVVKDGKVYWRVLDQLAETDNFARCFSGIRPNGKIILMSCSTGGMKNNGRPFDNIAQKMADATKRVVIAAKNLAHPRRTSLLIDDTDVGLYEPESHLYFTLPFYNKNLYESFRPTFKHCFPGIDKKTIHSRELSAIEIIREDLVDKSLIHAMEPLERSTEYIQFCTDDPRDKVIVLSAQHSPNDALDPSRHTKILRVFADRFDLRYKVIGSFEEICQEVENASKAGKLITVVIQGHGTSSDGMILSTDSDGKEKRIKASNNFTKCFSGVDIDGTIVLMGSSLGQNESGKNNIARKIANDSKRTVLATTCPIFPDGTKITSIDPFMLNHTAYSSTYNFFSIGCPENNENHFKTFNPQ